MKNVEELLVYFSVKEIISNIPLGDQWWIKGNLCPNVPISVGGAGDPPLSFYFHTFWVWNYLFLHPCQQFRQCLSIQTSRSGSSLGQCISLYNWICFICRFHSTTWLEAWSLQTLVHHTLNLMLLKIFWSGRQHSLFFHHEWIGMGLQGPVPLTWLPSSMLPWFLLAEIPALIFRDSTKI